MSIRDPVDFANDLLAEIASDSLPTWSNYVCESQDDIQDDERGTMWHIQFEDGAVSWMLNRPCGCKFTLTHEQLGTIPTEGMLSFIEEVTEAGREARLTHADWMTLTAGDFDCWEVKLAGIPFITIQLHHHQLVAWLASLLATAKIWDAHLRQGRWSAAAAALPT